MQTLLNNMLSELGLRKSNIELFYSERKQNWYFSRTLPTQDYHYKQRFNNFYRANANKSNHVMIVFVYVCTIKLLIK